MSFIWNVTSKCNLDCKICYLKEVNKNYNLLFQFKSLPSTILLTGGEPLLFEDSINVSKQNWRDMFYFQFRNSLVYRIGREGRKLEIKFFLLTLPIAIQLSKSEINFNVFCSSGQPAGFGIGYQVLWIKLRTKLQISNFDTIEYEK